MRACMSVCVWGRQAPACGWQAAVGWQGVWPETVRVNGEPQRISRYPHTCTPTHPSHPVADPPVYGAGRWHGIAEALVRLAA